MESTNPSVYGLLERSIARFPERPALSAAGREISYAELGERVDRLAAWLGERGVRRGDRVCVHLSKSVEEVVGMFAAARLGAAFVNVNAKWSRAQLERILADCEPRALLVEGRRLRELEAQLPPVVLARGPGGWEDPPTPSSSPASPEAVEPDALAAILYTSGSTGGPKGVMLSQRNLTLGAESVALYLENREEDRVLGLLPFSFDYGLSQITTMFLVGGCVCLLGVMMPAEIASTLRAQAITGLPALPSIWTPLVRYLEEHPGPLPALRYLTNTGGRIPDAILERMPRVFPGVDIFLMYGQTEGFRATYLPPQEFARKRGSIGRAIPNAEVFVVDPERGPCGPGEQGELLQRGDLLFQGYWGRPEATDAVLKPSPHLASSIGDEKVLHTGDLVRVDEDGCLWFVGRSDGLIKSSGFRISPDEVEEVVVASGLVREVVAFGVPDELLGERVEIAITADAPGCDVKKLRRHCSRNMPTYMAPSAIHAWDGEFPRTAHGKVDRRRIARTVQGRPPL